MTHILIALSQSVKLMRGIFYCGLLRPHPLRDMTTVDWEFGRGTRAARILQRICRLRSSRRIPLAEAIPRQRLRDLLDTIMLGELARKELKVLGC
jgi:hypothetical protein